MDMKIPVVVREGGVYAGERVERMEEWAGDGRVTVKVAGQLHDRENDEMMTKEPIALL